MNRKIVTTLLAVLAGSIVCSCNSATTESTVEAEAVSESDMAIEGNVDSTEVTLEVVAEPTEAKSGEVAPTGAELSLASEDRNTPVVLNKLDINSINSDEDRWYICEEQDAGEAPISFFRINENYMPDADGYLYFNKESNATNDKFSLLKYNLTTGEIEAEIPIDETDVISGDQYSTDVMSFEIGGTEYTEVDRYHFEYQDNGEEIAEIYSGVYEIDSDSNTLKRQEGFLGENEIVTSAFSTNNGTCLSVMDFYHYDFWGENCELRFYSDDSSPDNVIDLESVVDEKVNFVSYLASVDEDHYAVQYYNDEFETKNVIISSDGELIADIPSYFNENTGYFSSNGNLFVWDTNGLYVIRDGEPVCIIDAGHITDGSINFDIATFLMADDESISFVSYETYEYTNRIVQKYTLCDNPFEGREKITVGCPRYIDSVVLNQIAFFNETNSEYYAVPVVISQFGVNPSLNKDNIDSGMNRIIENTPVGTPDYYTDYLAEECAFSMELEKFISGPDAPDVLTTDGLWAQLCEPGYMDDLSGIYSSLPENEYYTNIFDANRKVTSRFIPVFYYVSGIIDISSREIKTETASISYSEYLNKVHNEWDDVDPIVFMCNSEEYAEELISTQYDLFVNRETGDYSFKGNENFNHMMSYMLYSVWLEGIYDVTHEYSDQYYGKMFAVEDFTYSMETYENFTLEALPSSDGRTISAEPMICLGIPSSADNKDGARQFILSCLSYESQVECADGQFGIPVNRDAVASIISGEPEDLKETINGYIDSIRNLYVVDVEVRFACYGPFRHLESGEYNDSDYAPDIAGRDIELNMEYFMQEDS